jgi:ribosomal protein S24E
MKIEIIKQEKNPFLQREEYMIEIQNEVTPSFDELKQEMKTDADLTVVKKINTNFGRNTFVAEVVVYEDKKAKQSVEVIPRKIKKKMEAEEKAAADAAKKAEAEAKAAEAAQVEEKPAEELAQEAPAEESKPEEETKAE